VMQLMVKGASRNPVRKTRKIRVSGKTFREWLFRRSSKRGLIWTFTC